MTAWLMCYRIVSVCQWILLYLYGVSQGATAIAECCDRIIGRLYNEKY